MIIYLEDNMSVSELKSYIAANGFDYIFDAPMSAYTTLKIGGCADILVQPKSHMEIVALITRAKEESVPVYFIGNGSNILVRDKGIRGLVIKFGNNMSQTAIEGETIIAQSGISMAHLANVACENSLEGFEFASGIPGTLGGGIVMNAGAYKGELKDVVTEATALCADGSIKVFAGDELDFSYRHSVFTDSDMLVLEAKVKLKKGNKDGIRARINELSAKRRNTQPLEFPSAGSAFKRPQNGYAAAMIDACGLKGYSVGGAQVSEKHAGFAVNKGGATEADFTKLLKNVRSIVNEHFGTLLEPEIITIGEK